jgi:hypothetical protein
MLKYELPIVRSDVRAFLINNQKFPFGFAQSKLSTAVELTG